MGSRHRISVFGRRFGPSLALGALAVSLACGCLPWSLEQPSALAFVGTALSEQYGLALSAKGRTEVSLLPLPRLAFHDIRLAAGKPDGAVLVEGGTLSIRLDLTALLAGRAELVSLALDGASVSLPTSEADTRWSGPLSRLSTRLASSGAAHPRRITLSGVTVTGRDGSAQSASAVDLVLSWPLWSDRLDLAGGFTWNGARTRVALTGLRAADLALGASSPFAFEAAWPAGMLALDGTGSFRDGIRASGTLRFETRSLPETLAWAGGGMALAPVIADVALDGRFDAQEDGLRFPYLSVRAGESVLEGAASAEFSGRRPSIRATLAAEQLNLAPLLAGALRVAGWDGSEGWGRHPLTLTPLLGGDLDLRLSGASARLGSVLLEDVASSVIVREERIDANLSRASLQGGSLKGRVQLSVSPGSDETEVKAQGAFDRIELGGLMVASGQIGRMLGPVQGAFALEGKGRDADALVRRLSGRASLAGGAGTLIGLDLADVIHRGGLAPGALARRNARTPFEHLALSLTLADGVGEIGEGTLTGRAVSAALRGRISLPERLFQARAELLPRPSAAGTSVSGPVFEIGGPWHAVSVRLRKEGEAEAFGALPPGSAAALPSLPPLLRATAP